MPKFDKHAYCLNHMYYTGPILFMACDVLIKWRLFSWAYFISFKAFIIPYFLEYSQGFEEKNRSQIIPWAADPSKLIEPESHIKPWQSTDFVSASMS